MADEEAEPQAVEAATCQERQNREHGLSREEQQNVVVQPLLTGNKDILGCANSIEGIFKI